MKLQDSLFAPSIAYIMEGHPEIFFFWKSQIFGHRQTKWVINFRGISGIFSRTIHLGTINDFEYFVVVFYKKKRKDWQKELLYRDSPVSAVSISAVFDLVRFTNSTKSTGIPRLVRFQLVRFFDLVRFFSQKFPKIFFFQTFWNFEAKVSISGTYISNFKKLH